MFMRVKIKVRPPGRKADAAIAARNERDFSVKLAHLFLLDVRFFSPLTSTV
jgi:hypothetical protein